MKKKEEEDLQETFHGHFAKISIADFLFKKMVEII